MPLIAGQEGNAIYYRGDFGPTFGVGHDLMFQRVQGYQNQCSVNLNNSYQCPTGQNAKTFLTGREFSTVDEMEIFCFDEKEAYTS